MPRYIMHIKSDIKEWVFNTISEFESIDIIYLIGYVGYICSMVEALQILYNVRSRQELIKRYTDLSVSCINMIITLRNNILHGNLVSFYILDDIVKVNVDYDDLYDTLKCIRKELV